MALLTIDVGNTQTALGLYEGDELTHDWRIATNRHATADELRVQLSVLFVADQVRVDQIEGAALACVVTRLTESWRRAILSMFGKEVLHCTAETASAAGVFAHDYPAPHEIGSDRIADAVAARALYGAPCVVVDFGTATNIEVIDENGCFAGGIIAPGVETSADALFSHASRLASTALLDPGKAIGRSTTEAVQIGIVCGEAARADGLVRRIFAQLGYEAPVIATGGLARLISQSMETCTAVDSELTLKGLRLLHEATKQAR